MRVAGWIFNGLQARDAQGCKLGMLGWWCKWTYQPGQRWRQNWASMAFCRMIVNLWKGNLAIASRSNSSRNSMTVPERCSCISSFGSPFSLVLEELMRVHLRYVGGGGVGVTTVSGRGCAVGAALGGGSGAGVRQLRMGCVSAGTVGAGFKGVSHLSVDWNSTGASGCKSSTAFPSRCRRTTSFRRSPSDHSFLKPHLRHLLFRQSSADGEVRAAG